MKSVRRAEAIWLENRATWQIKVQRNGVRKTFTSTIPGRRGKHAVEDDADEWLERASEDMPFPSAWDIFMAYQKEHAGTSNYLKHEMYGRLYIAPVIGHRRISAITPALWQSCIDATAKQGLSRRTCANVRGSISCFVNYARRARWDVERLERGDLTVPNSAPAPKPKRVLQPDTIRELFADPTIEQYGKRHLSIYSYAWQFFVVTGLRKGELVGLRNEDISGNLLTVRRSINFKNEETQGKNDNARRTIELNSVALSVLENQRKMLQDSGIASEWVFPRHNGDHASVSGIYDSWVTWCTQHGFRTSIHELRHTFVSIGKSDLPLQLMKATVGHSSTMDTYGIYGHDIDGDRHRAAQIMDSVLGAIIAQKTGVETGVEEKQKPQMPCGTAAFDGGAEGS